MISRIGLPFRHGTPLLRMFSVLSVLLLAGCGGGGGGGSGTTGTNSGNGSSGQSLTLNPTAVSATASTLDEPPTASSTVSIVNAAIGTQYYVFAKTTNSGIASVNVSNGASTIAATGNVTITFKAPSYLTPGTYNDTVTVTACFDQGCSQPLGNSPQTLSVQYKVTNPLPTVTSLSPSMVNAGSGAFTLHVTGTEFTTGAVVYWGSTALPTTWISSTQLTASVSAAAVAAGASIPITVSNSGGPGSSPVTFTVNPTILSLVEPNYVAAGGPSFTLNVYGSGFDSTSVVEWNGSGHPTTLVSATQLQIQVQAGDIARAGTASINVLTPSGNGGISSSLPVTIAVPPTWPASEKAVAYQDNPAHTGGVTFSSVTFPAASSWSVDLGGTVSYPVIADGKVFVTVLGPTGNTSLYALDRTTGATVWGPKAITGYSSPAYDNGVVFVSTGGQPSGGPNGTTAVGSVQAYDAATGGLLWNTSMYGFDTTSTSGPTAVGGYVYVTGGSTSQIVQDQGLFALNEQTGAISWSQPQNGAGYSIPAVGASGVYVNYSCFAYAFNPTTGQQLWSYEPNPPCPGGAGGTPYLVGNMVFITSLPENYGGTVVNATTGAWIQPYFSSISPVFDAQTEYFVSAPTQLYAYLSASAPASNVVNWTFNGDNICAATVVSQYVIAEGCTGKIYGIDSATGNSLWNVDSGTPGSWQITNMFPFTTLGAGEGVLVVPNGTRLVTYTLATSP